MNTNRIQKLIGLYWEGAITLEEERELCAFFLSHSELPPALEQWRDWFAGKEAISRMELGEGFDKKILSLVNSSQTGKKLVRMKRFLWLSATVAAVALIAFVFLTPGMEPGAAVPEIASAEVQQGYEAVKELLYFTSAKMNQAESVLTEGLGKIGVINDYIHIK